MSKEQALFNLSMVPSAGKEGLYNLSPVFSPIREGSGYGFHSIESTPHKEGYQSTASTPHQTIPSAHQSTPHQGSLQAHLSTPHHGSLPAHMSTPHQSTLPAHMSSPYEGIYPAHSLTPHKGNYHMEQFTPHKYAQYSHNPMMSPPPDHLSRASFPRSLIPSFNEQDKINSPMADHKRLQQISRIDPNPGIANEHPGSPVI